MATKLPGTREGSYTHTQCGIPQKVGQRYLQAYDNGGRKMGGWKSDTWLKGVTIQIVTHVTGKGVSLLCRSISMAILIKGPYGSDLPDKHSVECICLKCTCVFLSLPLSTLIKYNLRKPGKLVPRPLLYAVSNWNHPGRPSQKQGQQDQMCIMDFRTVIIGLLRTRILMFFFCFCFFSLLFWCRFSWFLFWTYDIQNKWWLPILGSRSVNCRDGDFKSFFFPLLKEFYFISEDKAKRARYWRRLHINHYSRCGRVSYFQLATRGHLLPYGIMWNLH